MARKNLNRGLGALAALGALSYHVSRGKGTNRAPVEDRSTGFPADSAAPVPSVLYDPDAFERDVGGLQADVSGPHAEAGGIGRAITGAATNLPAPAAAPAAAAPAAAGPAVRPPAAGPAVRPPAAGPAPARSVAAPAAARSASAELASPDADFPPAGRTRSAAPPLIRVLPPPLLPLTPLLFNAATARSAAPADAQAQKTAREAAAERRSEARRVEPPVVGLNNPYYGRTGAQRAAALRAKGGAIKTKKMASGGMTSASKRGDGIASKGKTKCKMY